LNIYEKLNEVRKKVQFVHKDTTVGFGQNTFKAVSHDQVTSAVRQHFVDQGIIILTSQIGKGISVDGQTKSGANKIRFEAMYEIIFLNMEDGSDKLTVTVEAHAEGSDDKCPGKALSYATKSAMLKVLMLETGDNDEEGVKNTIDVKQTGMIAQLITDTNTEIDKFCAAYQIQKVSDLPSGMFAQALAQLQKKMKGKNDAAKNTTDAA
jgi:hypothetical protein